MLSIKSAVSLVIPCYNSQNTLEQTVQQSIMDLQQEVDLELILVNDASGDATWRKIEELQQKYPQCIRSLNLKQNQGEHAAVWHGLQLATKPIAAIMDDDLQHSPAEILLLLQELQRGSWDVVYGKYKQKRHSTWRNMLSKIHGYIAKFVLHPPPRLYLSSFKVCQAQLFQKTQPLHPKYLNLDAHILLHTKKIGQIEVSHFPGLKSQSGYTFKKLIGLHCNLWKTWFVTTRSKNH